MTNGTSLAKMATSAPEAASDKSADTTMVWPSNRVAPVVRDEMFTAGAATPGSEEGGVRPSAPVKFDAFAEFDVVAAIKGAVVEFNTVKARLSISCDVRADGVPFKTDIAKLSISRCEGAAGAEAFSTEIAKLSTSSGVGWTKPGNALLTTEKKPLTT